MIMARLRAIVWRASSIAALLRIPSPACAIAFTTLSTSFSTKGVVCEN
jgi:hypothetical protein